MIRVIPRDLFNDANLLKCLGMLWIKLDNWRDHDARLEEDGAAFDIQQNEADGSTECVNVIFTRRGERFRLCRPMNSRELWPLWLETEDDQIPVFGRKGELTPEFIEFVSPIDGAKP
jgi:hypothetical protein